MIQIDGVTYNVPLISVDRKADFLDKYAERTVDGALNREIIGVYYNYTLRFGAINDRTQYEALWDSITAPIEFRSIGIPEGSGMNVFEGYFGSPRDAIRRIIGGVVFYMDLQVNAIARYPTRR